MDARGIAQPVLSEEGRQKVLRNDNFTFAITAVNELKPISGNVTFDISDKEKLVQDLTGFLQKSSPDFDKDLQESEVLIDYLVSYLIRMEGELIGDDFNFMAGRYNDLRLISKAIDHSNLWFNLASRLIQDYAERIIVKGEAVDAEEEANIFVNLPIERMILKRDENSGGGNPWIPEEWHREPVRCYFTDFEDFIKLAYPGYIHFTEVQKSVYRNYVNTINPELELINDEFIYSEEVLFCLPDPGKIKS